MSKTPVRVLHLHLKGQYFDQIAAGTKRHEYRLVAVWRKRLENRSFDEIQLHRGYPKRGAPGRTLYRRWNGYKIEQRQHPHFGKDPVEVYAIDVSVTLPSS